MAAGERVPTEAGWQGDERCWVCEQRYSLELAYRCVGCDGPLGPICAVVVREREEVSCRPCLDEERAG